MTVAFGTSTPTSTTVVATRTAMSPAANSSITRRLSAAGMPPVSSPTAKSGKTLRER